MKRKINEIFYSLQGEGARTGSPSVFIRFSGCNLKCPFCDTDHLDGVLMDDTEILTEVNKWPAQWVVLTGGEPSLWIDEELIALLHANGKKIAIETNGTNPLPAGIDWITFSPKSGMAEGGEEIALTAADEIKVVFTGQNLEPYFNLLPDKGVRMYLQPCYVENEKDHNRNILATIQKVMEDPRWNLSLQTHRVLNIR